MGRQATRWLLVGLVPVLAMLSAHGIASHDQDTDQATPLTVTHGSALVATGRYTIDVSDEVAAPARITTAGQQVEGLALIIESIAARVPGLAVGNQSMSTYGQTLRGRDIAVLVDGFICSVAALVAVRLNPQCRAWLLFAR